MNLYSSYYLKQLSRNKTLNESQKIFSEKDKTHSTFDIFLCHSFLDKDEVEGLYLELTRMRYTVYVDWIVDPHLDRNNVTKATATHIRERLRSSKCLLLAISTNAAISKWMPWELGFIDGYRSKCAIIPVSRDASPPKSYRGVEYLSLYPFIKKYPDEYSIDRLLAINDANTYTLFENWINGTAPSFKNRSVF